MICRIRCQLAKQGRKTIHIQSIGLSIRSISTWTNHSFERAFEQPNRSNNRFNTFTVLQHTTQSSFQTFRRTVHRLASQLAKHSHNQYDMSKHVLVPIANGSEELEATSIITVLRRAGIDVTVLTINQSSNQSSEQPGQSSLVIEGARKVKIVGDKSITSSANEAIDQSIFPSQGFFDMIVLPGGIEGAKRFNECNQLNQLLISQASNQRWIAALCASPATVLSPLKLVRRKAIGHPSTLDQLKDTNGQPLYQSINQMIESDPVVMDEPVKLITGIGAGHSASFALACVKELVGEVKVNEIKKAMCLYSKL